MYNQTFNDKSRLTVVSREAKEEVPRDGILLTSLERLRFITLDTKHSW